MGSILYLKTCKSCKAPVVGMMYLLDNSRICRECALKHIEEKDDEKEE